MKKKSVIRKQTADLYYDAIDSPVGKVYLIFDGPALVEVDFRRPHHGKKTCPAPVLLQFSEYFRGKRRTFDIETRFLSGTPFQKKVWRALCDIPYGEVRSYAWLADRAGNKQAARAVGQALNRNPLPIVFPCHRVVSADGSLGGYSSGKRIKQVLLSIESPIR